MSSKLLQKKPKPPQQRNDAVVFLTDVVTKKLALQPSHYVAVASSARGVRPSTHVSTELLHTGVIVRILRQFRVYLVWRNHVFRCADLREMPGFNLPDARSGSGYPRIGEVKCA